MLVCPRCGTSNIRNPRSLSIHLARYCTGPTLPSNVFANSTLTSRSPDGQHPLSMATTALQQARHFNAPEGNIALPPINTLYAMPSISHLSSTATNSTHPNKCNADSDDADFAQCNDTSEDADLFQCNDTSDCAPAPSFGSQQPCSYSNLSKNIQIGRWCIPCGNPTCIRFHYAHGFGKRWIRATPSSGG